MLRVISGKYRSRKLKEVDRELTRPTTDKNKEVLFNTLGQYFDGGKALDLFAGSGSLGIEAISRGMDYCDFVDKETIAVKTIAENLHNLKVNEKVKTIKKDVFMFLQETDVKYDLIMADPPYKLDKYLEMLDIILSRQLLKMSGIIVLESSNETLLPEEYKGLMKYKEKILGSTKFSLYEYKKEGNL